MPISLDFPFSYVDEPVFFVRVFPVGGIQSYIALAQIDTGSDQTIFDSAIADSLAIDLASAPRIRLLGIGGVIEARLATVRLDLLANEALSLWIEVAFAERAGHLASNLVGLDVLEHFDFSLSHAARAGYFGIPERV